MILGQLTQRYIFEDIVHMHITAHPDWVLKHKKKGILIMKRDDKYYLYRVSSHWNKEK